MKSEERGVRSGRLAGFLLVLVPLMILAGRPSWTGDVFAFRDAAHYYYPQFAWESRMWLGGEPPLWNPQDNLGVPVAADPTASLFYPGKLILHAPSPLTFAQRFNLYIVLHLSLAAVATYGLARSWRLSHPAAALAALSYACGGNVLFLYGNVVYLVGAAWLPAAFWATDRIARRADAAGVLGLAAALAMMTLGGDPQGALHAVLVGMLRLWFRDAHLAPSAEQAATPARAPLPCPAAQFAAPSRRRVAGLFVVAVVAAILLSAAQCLPSWRASRDSLRAAFDTPRSLAEIATTPRESPEHDAARPKNAASDTLRGLFGPPAVGTHHQQLYDFSVGPWRLAELLIPNGFGSMFPRHARWSFAIPAEGRIWTPSLFQGLAPIVLILAGWWARRAAPRNATMRWLSASAVLAVLAGCGSYGLGWLVRELTTDAGLTAPEWLGDPVGGIYWWLVVLLPGYVQFRYPAKWWTVAALAIACLAAHAFDRWIGAGNRRDGEASEPPPASGLEVVNRTLGRVAATLFALLLLALVTLVFFRVTGRWDAWLADLPADDWLGPFDARQAFRDTLVGILSSLTVAATIWAFTRIAVRSTSPALRPRLAWLLLALTGIELIAAHAWLVVSAPRSTWDESRQALEQLGTSRFARTRSSAELPREWRSSSSDQRMIDTVRWDARTLFSKLHLLGAAGSVDSPVAAESLEYALLLETARRARSGTDSAADFPADFADLLGVAGTIQDVAADEATTGDLPRLPLRLRAVAAPRVRVVRRVKCLPEMTSRTPSIVRERTRAVLFAAGRVRDWNREAVVETSSPDDVAKLADLVADAPQNSLAVDSAQIVEDQATRLRLEVALPSPALLVLTDRFDSDWQVSATNARGEPLMDARILRTNRVLRGVWLPAGEWTVEFRYRPVGAYVGATISVVGWCLWLAALVVASRRAHPNKPR